MGIAFSAKTAQELGLDEVYVPSMRAPDAMERRIVPRQAPLVRDEEELVIHLVRRAVYAGWVDQVLATPPEVPSGFARREQFVWPPSVGELGRRRLKSLS